MGHALTVEYVWLVLAIAGCVGLVWLAYRIEPHWVSKDGHRFLCNAQQLSPQGTVEGRARETRVTVLPDGSIHLATKRYMRRRQSVWKLASKSDDPPRRREVYLLRHRDPAEGMVALRLPSNSRAVPVLDALLPGG